MRLKGCQPTVDRFGQSDGVEIVPSFPPTPLDRNKAAVIERVEMLHHAVARLIELLGKGASRHGSGAEHVQNGSTCWIGQRFPDRIRFRAHVM